MSITMATTSMASTVRLMPRSKHPVRTGVDQPEVRQRPQLLSQVSVDLPFSSITVWQFCSISLPMTPPTAISTTRRMAPSTDQMVPMRPVTKPAVASPSPPRRPCDAAISRLACRERIIAGTPRNSPHMTMETIPSTRLVVALLAVGGGTGGPGIGYWLGGYGGVSLTLTKLGHR